MAEVGKDSIAKVPTFSDNPFEVAEQPWVIEKEKNANQSMAPDATKPSTATQDPLAEKEVFNKMEIVLATLPLPTKVDLASKGPEVSETTSA